MPNVFGEDKEIMNVGGGYGSYGGGGAWAMIILVVVVLWLLFKDGHRDGYRDGGYPGYGFGGGCGPCVQPTFKDESNFEEERNINSKLCCMDKSIWETDRDVWKTACETQQVEHCEAEKTRDLIRCEAEKNLRDKLVEQNSIIQTLKSEAFTEKKIDQVLAAIGCTNQRIGMLECEIPRRPPVWAECQTPNSHDIDCGGDRFPRRGRIDDGCGCFA